MTLTPFELTLLHKLSEIAGEFSVLEKHLEQVNLVSSSLPLSFVDNELTAWVQCRNTLHSHADVAPMPGVFYAPVLYEVNGSRCVAGAGCKAYGDIIRNYGRCGA